MQVAHQLLELAWLRAHHGLIVPWRSHRLNLPLQTDAGRSEGDTLGSGQRLDANADFSTSSLHICP
jgi:hypothetical protein